jgi:peptide/nickel transport system permease protein
MTTYILRRVLQAVPVLLVVSVVVFILMRLIPGDPALSLMGMEATEEQLVAVRHAWGLDQPLYIQYLYWMRHMLTGDLGESYFSRMSVSMLISQKFPATVELTFISMTLALLIGIPAGIIAAVKRNSLVDYLTTTVVLFGISFPDFWLGILLILLFALTLGWLPPLGHVAFGENPLQNLRYVILPSATLGLILASPIMRFLRSGMLDVLSEEYIRVARAKGLKESAVLVRHALKNAAIPTVTLVGVQVASLLGGTAIVETVFAWPGVGWLLVNAVVQRDYAVIQALVMMMAGLFVLINLLVDVLYAALDPRIRFH